MTYADGAQETISVDESFRVKEHPIVMSNVYGSEAWDGRLEQPGWCEAGFGADSWTAAEIVPDEDAPKGELTEQFQPAVKVIKTYTGKLMGTVNGRDIYDFGQNMSGILELDLRGRTGAEIRLYPAEKPDPDGDADQMAKGWMPVDSCITCVIGKDGAWEPYRMKFTYFAGRFAAVERGSADIRNFKAHAITSAWAADGSFTCDDDRYNRIYDLVEKAVEANMVSVHTDCPTIERFAWQEPNHLMAPAIFYMKNGNKLWEKLEACTENIKKNYNEKLLVKHPELGIWCYNAWDHPDEVFLTQASQALPLYWGLAPEEIRDDIVKAFRYTLKRDGAFIRSEAGLPYVIQTARENGLNDLIARFITRTEHPSYYAFVLDGETTLGEYWENNPRSHCHDMMGHIGMVL